MASLAGIPLDPSPLAVALRTAFACKQMARQSDSDKSQCLLNVFLDHGAPPATTQALLAAAAGRAEAVPMGLQHEFVLLKQDAGLASADDSENHYLQQVVAALTQLLEPGQAGGGALSQLESATSLDAVPDEFVCPISQEVMMEPVTLCEVRSSCDAICGQMHWLVEREKCFDVWYGPLSIMFYGRRA